MHQTGLVSVSFRKLTPEQVIRAASAAGLKWIEWGSDVHAPCADEQALEQIVALQKQYAVGCSSYGTYFRLGTDPVESLQAYIRAAKRLGTHILRLWCGSKCAQDHTPEEKEALLAQCKAAAALAEAAGVILCMECHIGTFTQTKEGALALMEAVDSPAFRMYWQPNQNRTVEENLEYARAIRDYVLHIHVFQWKGKQRFSLESGIREWQDYLSEFSGSHMLLLEFMPDDRPESLRKETEILQIIKGV